MKKSFWVLLCLFIFFQKNATAEKQLYVTEQQSEIQMKFLTCEEPPMNFMKEDEITGLITDVVKEIIVRAKIKCTIDLQPWARVFKTGLSEPNVALFTAARTKQRKNLFKWVGPLINKRWVLIARQGSSIKIESLDDARKLYIGVMQEDARAKLLRKNNFNNLHLVTNHIQGLQMLMSKRIDLFASSDIEIPVLAKQAEVNPSELKVVREIMNIQSYILISKKTPDTTVKILQEAFEQIKKDGTLAKIGNKWAGILNIPLTGEHGILEIK